MLDTADGLPKNAEVSLKRGLEATTGQRVFEYTGDDGVVYYSLHRTPNMVNPPKRLVLKSRIGEHLTNFVSRLRRDYWALVEGDDG